MIRPLALIAVLCCLSETAFAACSGKIASLNAQSPLSYSPFAAWDAQQTLVLTIQNTGSAACSYQVSVPPSFYPLQFGGKLSFSLTGSGATAVNSANFTLATPAPMLSVADPCGEIPGCSYLTANPPSTASCISYNGNGYNGSLPSGCYSYLNLNGATVTMSGTYVLTGSSNFNGANVTGSGVTLYIAAGGTAPNFNGANVSFTAPTTGNDAGVLYYQVPSNTSDPNFNGSSDYYNGLIYCPGATGANFNGSGGGYVVLVFGSWNYNGSGAVDFASPPPGGEIVRQAVLAQ